MAGDGSVIIDILADDSDFEKTISRLQHTAKTGLKAVATSVTAAGAALSGMAAYAVKVGAEFEAAMSQVQAISGAAGADLQALQDIAKEMGATTKFSATQAAEALQYMAMAGWKTEQMISGLPGVMNLAAASGEDLASVSDIVTDALTAFGLQVEEAGRFADVLAAAASNSNTNVAMMGATFRYVAPIAGAMGYRIEDAATAIGLMANAGIKGEQAGTALRSLLTRLSKPPKEAAEAIRALGLHISDASGKMLPMAEVVEQLRQRFTGLTAEQKTQMAASLAGQEAMSGLLAIVNASEEDYQKLTEAIAESGGAAQQMADVMNDNLQGAVTLLRSGIEGLGILFYESVDSSLKDAVQVAGEYVQRLNRLFYEIDVDPSSKELQALAAEYQATGLSMEQAVQKASDTLRSQAFVTALPQELGSILADIATRLAEATPQLLDAGTQMVQALLQGVSDNAPQLLQGAGQIILSFGKSVLTLLPQFAQAGAALAVQLAEGLSQSLPLLIPKAVEMVSAAALQIAEHADTMLAAGIDLIAALGQGLIEAIPQLIEQIPQIVISIADAINHNAAKLLGVAIKLMIQLGIGLVKAIPTLIRNIPAIIEAMVKAFFAFQWLNLGKTIITNLSAGLRSMAGNAKQAMAEVSATVRTNAMQLPAKLLEIGKNIVRGLANGIRAGAKWAVSAIKELGANLVANLKDFLGIHSPSRLMQDQVGRNIALGVAEGIRKNASSVDEAIKELSQKIFDASDAWIEEQKFYDRLSAREEVAAWEWVTKKEGLLAEEREQAERKLYTARKALAEEQRKIEEEYARNLQSRVEALQGFAGLFDAVKQESETTAEELINNLQGQVQVLAAWQQDMEKLAGMPGMSDALMEELRQLGPKSAEQVHVLASMTEHSLEQYVQLFEEKARLAREAAEKEMKGVAVPLRLQVDEETTKATLSAVTETAAVVIETLSVGMDDTMFRITETAEKIAQAFTEQIQKQKGQYYSTGVLMVQGLWQGIRSQRSMLINNIISMLEAAVAAAKEAMEIHSPSRVWGRIGQQMAAGTGVGFVEQMRKASRQMQQALQDETLRISAQGKIQAAREAAEERGTVITNHNDHGVKQTVNIYQPVKSPADTARALRRAGRELATI